MSINQSNQKTSNKYNYAMIKGKHIKIVNASPSKIFHLLCPIEEYKWIPKWQCEVLHSKSGHAELGCVFKEDFTSSFIFNTKIGAIFWGITRSHLLSPKLPETIWNISKYDLNSHRIQFTVETENIATIIYDVDIIELGKESSEVTWYYQFTPLNKQGLQMINSSTKRKVELTLKFLGETLAHYCKTGDMLKPSILRIIKKSLNIN